MKLISNKLLQSEILQNEVKFKKKNCTIIIRSKTMEDEISFPLNSKNPS